MIKLLNHELQNDLHQKLYRYRFLLTYILIGTLSVGIELVILRALQDLVYIYLAQLLAVTIGIMVAFTLNVRYNFKVPKPKRRKAFIFFALISILSFSASATLKGRIIQLNIPYEFSRYLSAGCFFLAGYILHRKFSFKEYKQVGVAVYANGNEDIKGIWEKIKFTGDFIHIDIIDRTFHKAAPDPTTYRIETVRAYWPNKEIHCHIMSKAPLQWIKQVSDFVDTIIIHHEIDGDVHEMIDQIKKRNLRAGLCLRLETPVEVLKEYIHEVDEVMLLTIPHPGYCEQKFDFDSLKRIEKINNFNDRNDFVMCIDGGVNDQIIQLLQVEKVISGSFVLNAQDPMKMIMRLQTSNQYEAI